MGYKTIYLSEEANKRLKERKNGSESFSDIIIRLTINTTLRDFVGLISKEASSKLEIVPTEFRKKPRKPFQK